MITFYQGNSVDLDVTVVLNNATYDVTNDKIWFTIKNSFTDPDSAALLQVTTESGISFTNATAGQILISLTPVLTQNLPTGVELDYDIQIRTPSGKVYTIIVDQVLVNPKVTQTLNYV